MSLPDRRPDVRLADPDDLDKNAADAPRFEDLLARRMHRRHLLKGGVGAMAVAGLGPLALGTGSNAAAAGPFHPVRPLPASRAASTLGFGAVAKSLADGVQVPEGYTATVIYATGDAIDESVPDYAGDGSEADYAHRAGDHHDGMSYFGLGPTGRRLDGSTSRALIAVNHENVSGTAQFLHPSGETNVSGGGPRPESEVIKEIDAHGVSVFEIRKNTAGRFERVKRSPFNRRITARTVMEIAGPARGTHWMKTRFSPAGLNCRGTLNNCGNGQTPWGTFLTCEENWAGYFLRAAGDDAKRSEREEAALQRNGMRPGQAGFAHRRWASVVPADPASTDFARWDVSVHGAGAADDFRNEHNTFGYVVEVDPYDPAARPKKRTAMGRRATEGAWCSLPKAGRSLAFYIGCDSRNEYVYKFVPDRKWNPADAQRGGLATGDKYLDRGSIYAAVFEADGSGRWEPLTLANPKLAAGARAIVRPGSGPERSVTYTFEDLADICVNTRLAAGAAGATRMDRPEWTAVNPVNGEVYITMTENPDRGNTGLSGNNVPNPPLDAANPRYWADPKGASSQGAAIAAQRGNVNGHIVRIREDGDDPGATSFRWDVFVFGAQAQADPGQDDVHYQQHVNLSGLTEGNDFSKPDGCWFSPTTGILWIETDDNTMTDRTNCMLLAAIPGRVGDGGPVTVVNRASGSPVQGVRDAGVDTPVLTQVGRRVDEATFRRFLTAPRGAEVTGLAESPDGRVLFVNIQHPGENSGRAGALPASVALTPATPNGPFESHWPGNGVGTAPYGPGGANARPRSATVVITKNDGGVIGL